MYCILKKKECYLADIYGFCSHTGCINREGDEYTNYIDFSNTDMKANNCEKSWQATKYIVVVQSIEYVKAENYEDAAAVAVENAKDNLRVVDWKIVG